MADGLFYHDTREPCIAADITAVTLAGTNKALYGASNFPVLGGQYFSRPGKKLRIRAFGRITTALTPGNLTLGILYGTGADANGVVLASSAAQTLLASQTNLSWRLEVYIHCRSIGSTGTLFAVGVATFHTGVIAAGTFLIPASAAVVSAACDLTAANIISIQALRSGSTVETMQVHDLDVISVN